MNWGPILEKPVMWLWIFILVLSFSESKPPPGGLEKEFSDVVALNKYAKTTRELVSRILKAIQVFDCYDNMVKGKRTGWTAGSELSASAFDALRGLRNTEKEFTNTVASSLVQLKELQTTLHQKPDIVGKIDTKDSPCFMGGKMYDKDDCQDCRDSIPGFKSKAMTMSELREIILQMQNTIPKQFIYYANEIFVIAAEAIRIIDKMWSCLSTESDAGKCASRDKSILFFTKKMEEITEKENDHVKMVIAENTKMKTIVAQLAQQVVGTLWAMAECLQFKSGVSIFDLWQRQSLQALMPAAKNAELKWDTAHTIDTKNVIASFLHDRGSSVRSRVAQG